ncbi:hypothetical protein HDV05_001191, partial [Chytridiales sp. JEL 0842]
NDLAAEFLKISAVCGGHLQAYAPIVGAGAHGAVLHYRTGEDFEAAFKPIPEPSFVLIDAAPEYLGWASDLTRTYARGDKWTPEMEEVHGIVYRIQQKFMLEYYNEGALWADINRQIMVDLTVELKEAGFLKGSIEELMQKNLYQVFMPHGLGHPVGLEVHDPTPSKLALSGAQMSAFGLVPNTPTSFPSAWSGNLNAMAAAMVNYTVFRGHITTVEPGVYFIPKLLELVRSDADETGRNKYINWDKIDSGWYVQLGGVRIEDVIMIDHEGRKRIVTYLDEDQV